MLITHYWPIRQDPPLEFTLSLAQLPQGFIEDDGDGIG